MAAIDKLRSLQTITVPNTTPDGQRLASPAENNKRTEKYDLRITGQVDITAAGVALRNRGSILAALTNIGYTDGGTDKVIGDARMMRFLAECMAPSPLPATRLAGVGIQAATLLSETVPLWMSAVRTMNPNETKYVEVNKQLQQEVFLNPFRQITRLSSGGALAGTITNLACTIEQRYDDDVAVAPWLSPFYRQITQDVVAANAALKIDLRGSRYIRGLVIQQDHTTGGEVADIINGVVLRGDAAALIGDRPVPFVDLRQAAAEEFGGELPPGYLFIDFARYGRLSTLWNPYQDTNLRLELDCQPSALGAGSQVRVGLWEYERTPATVQGNLPVNI